MISRLSLRRPADLVGLVPYLLGFHPERSLVVVLFAEGRLEVTARLDLAAADAECLADSLPRMCAHTGADSAVLIAFGSEAEAGPALALAESLVPAEVLDVLRVDDGRWWSLWCQDESCCPPEGTPLDEASEAQVQAVVAGMQALPSRAALVDGVSAPTGERAGKVALALSDAIAALAGTAPDDAAVEASRRVRRLLGSGRTLELDECAELAVLVAAIPVRDEVLLGISRANATEHVELWGQVVRSSVGAYACAPLAILGIASWVSGNGALLSACLERGQATDEEYSFWFVLEDVLARALPPSRWADVVADAA